MLSHNIFKLHLWIMNFALGNYIYNPAWTRLTRTHSRLCACVTQDSFSVTVLVFELTNGSMWWRSVPQLIQTRFHTRYQVSFEMCLVWRSGSVFRLLCSYLSSCGKHIITEMYIYIYCIYIEQHRQNSHVVTLLKSNQNEGSFWFQMEKVQSTWSTKIWRLGIPSPVLVCAHVV